MFPIRHAWSMPLSLCGLLLCAAPCLTTHAQDTRANDATGERVYLAMGFRVGEVTQDSAIVWTRLTATPQRNWNGVVSPIPTSPTRVMVENPDIPADEFEGAVPGATGQVRIALSEAADLKDVRWSDWVAVDPDADYTHQLRRTGLKSATRYYLAVEGRKGDGKPVTRSASGSFVTAPAPDQWQDVRFTVITGQMYYHRDDERGFRIYPAMSRINAVDPLPPDFIVPTGDTVYYDRDNPRPTNVALARLHWQRIYSLPWLVEFHRWVPGYWEKDDHDTFFDDCYPTLKAPWIEPFTYEQGVRVFREQAPVGEKLFRTVRWGKALQVWLPEVRDFRSPNDAPDGPDKTIWGKEQKEWLKRSIRASDAHFRVLVSPTAIVGPDNDDQEDSHANKAFATEGDEFRRWTLEQQLKNFYVACGDRHWQYMSTDPATGLREFSCGPASDVHAFTGPGYTPKYHSFYRSGGGFLSVSISKGSQQVLARPQRIIAHGGVPTINFRFHDVDGKILYEYRDAALVKD
jgi:alkaline phosphatase D